MPGFDLHPVAGALGAEVTGLDLRADLPAQIISELNEALAHHQVLFFRKQALTPAQQQAFGERFGALQVHPAYPHPEGADAVAVLEHSAEKPSRIEDWHTDMTYGPRPPLGSILRGVIVPEAGGDTLWASMAAAYEALSDRMQRYLSGMFAEHSFAHGFRHSLAAPGGERLLPAVKANPPVQHPVIRVHPVTGRKLLFVNALFTTHLVGVPERESGAVLAFLWQHATSPEFTVRFRWQRDSIAFWDNRGTQHKPVNDHGLQHRLMHRVTIDGDVPFGP
ncbi:MAG: taurine dioxygenase [Myxococcales bacterium]|nr:taurine dioxygenase [Myxococcales bacterium]